MKKLTVLFSLLFVTISFAHVQMGIYKGELADGKTCSLEVKQVSFVDNIKNPLNERIEMVYEGQTFVMQHLPKVDTEAPAISFEHGVLSGVKGTAEGGVALVMHMDQQKHTPADFVFVTHKFKTDEVQKLVCSKIAHQD